MRAENNAVLRVEATDLQALGLEERLTKLDTNIAYQEEQHGPILVVCVRFRAEQETAVRKILGEIGIPTKGETPNPTA